MNTVQHEEFETSEFRIKSVCTEIGTIEWVIEQKFKLIDSIDKDVVTEKWRTANPSRYGYADFVHTHADEGNAVIVARGLKERATNLETFKEEVILVD